MEETQAAAKTSIRPNIANMVKTKSGSYHKDDFVGTTLNGLSVEQVSEIATQLEIDVTKYEHLNPGQIRMTIGNKFRGMTAIVDVPEVDGKPDQKAVDKNEKAYAVRDLIEDLAGPMKEANEEAAAAKAAAKANPEPTESEGGEAA